MPPTYANGKICYIDMPAVDVARSADFYSSVFGWKIRQRGDGSTAFDDGVGQVSGTWSVGRPPASQPGLLVYVMVDDAEATVRRSWPMVVKLCSLSAEMRLRLRRGFAILVAM